jgi:DNA-directed RNA polymerase specialized sigma54-like protein
MRIVTEIEAIRRLEDHCRSWRYDITTEDPEALKLNSKIIKREPLSNERGGRDEYKIHDIFNGQRYTIHQGALLEVLFDLNLLEQDERINPSFIDTLNGEGFLRTSTVRQPWDRILSRLNQG